MKKRTKYAQTMYLYTGYESLRFIKKKNREKGNVNLRKVPQATNIQFTVTIVEQRLHAYAV